jgi:hypothetical protein
MDEEITGLEQLLDRVCESEAEQDRVKLGAILDVFGGRSFGPLLTLAGLVTLAPLVGDIPGVPTIMGVVVVLTAAQMLIRRDHVWLPAWLLDRSVNRDKLHKALGWLRKPARFVDRMTGRRLTFVFRGPGQIALALLCLGVGAVMPLMEAIPFSANAAGVALTLLGLSLVAKDGALAMAGIVVTVGAFWLVISNVV